MENQLRKSWLAVRQEMTLNAPVDVPSTGRKTILQKLNSALSHFCDYRGSEPYLYTLIATETSA